MSSLPHIPQPGSSEADLEALATLDANGLFMAPGESEQDYLERLHQFAKRMHDFKADMETGDGYDLDDLKLRPEKSVARELIEECARLTDEHYAFRAEWVPAFYINPKFSWLFGGCAYYSMPDMFTVVILRKTFRNRQRWLFYDRREILSHEMCHAARMAIGSEVFEERLAYQVSGSGFRRRFGGLLHSPFDTLAILGSTFLLLGMQMLRTFLLPGLPIFPFWMLVIGIVGFMLGRDRRCHRTLNRTIENLDKVTEHSAAVAFRCSDAEIEQISRFENAEELRGWIEKTGEHDRRWQVIVHRFMAAPPPTTGAGSPLP